MRIVGVFLFFSGLGILCNPYSGITGYSVAGDLEQSTYAPLGFGALVGGIIVFLLGIDHKKKELEEYILEGMQMPNEPPR